MVPFTTVPKKIGLVCSATGLMGVSFAPASPAEQTAAMSASGAATAMSFFTVVLLLIGNLGCETLDGTVRTGFFGFRDPFMWSG
jgi:hypothetical protein